MLTARSHSLSFFVSQLFTYCPPPLSVFPITIAGFVLGPQKLGQMARDLGAVAGELKDVPKEFQEVKS